MDSEQMHAGAARVFDIDDRLKRLSDLGDQLETFRSAVDFELFRPELNAALGYTDRTEGGRPPFDPVLMFKILAIQATNNLSDERADPAVVYAVPGTGVGGPCSGRPHDLAVLGEADHGWGDQEIVRAVRCHVETSGLHCHVGSGRRCQSCRTVHCFSGINKPLSSF
jgi:hypothetical protein